MKMRNHVSYFIAVSLLVMMPAVTMAASPSFMGIQSHYESIRSALLNDTTEGVSQHAKEIAKQASKMIERFSAEEAGVALSSAAECGKLLKEIAEAAGALGKAPDLDASRDAFYALSKPMIRWREMLAAPADSLVVYCPMAKRSWVQPDEEIGNPYYGQSMARCGKIVSATEKTDAESHEDHEHMKMGHGH